MARDYSGCDFFGLCERKKKNLFLNRDSNRKYFPSGSWLFHTESSTPALLTSRTKWFDSPCALIVHQLSFEQFHRFILSFLFGPGIIQMMASQEIGAFDLKNKQTQNGCWASQKPLSLSRRVFRRDRNDEKYSIKIRTKGEN